MSLLILLMALESTHIRMRPNLQIPTLLAHFTYRSSFERNYLIIHPILIF